MKKFSDKRIQNCQLAGSNKKGNLSFDKDPDSDYLGSLLLLLILSVPLLSVFKVQVEALGYLVPTCSLAQKER